MVSVSLPIIFQALPTFRHVSTERNFDSVGLPGANTSMKLVTATSPYRWQSQSVVFMVRIGVPAGGGAAFAMSARVALSPVSLKKITLGSRNFPMDAPC